MRAVQTELGVTSAPTSGAVAAFGTDGFETRGGPRGRDASLWVFVGGGLLILIALAAILSFALYERKDHLERVSERNALVARVFAENITRSVESASLAGATLGSLLSRGAEPEGAEMKAALEQTQVNLPFLRGVGVVDAQGLIVGSADPLDLGFVIDLSAMGGLPLGAKDRLGALVQARRLSDLRPGGPPARRGVGFLPLVRRVELPHGRIAYIVLQINADAFTNAQQVALTDGDSTVALTSYTGRLIAVGDVQEQQVQDDLTALAPFRDFLPARESGTWEGAGVRPGVQLGAFRVSSSQPLVVIVESDRAAVVAAWAQGAHALLVAGVVIVVFLGLMTGLAARSVRSRERAWVERDQAKAAVLARERELVTTVESLQEMVFRTDAAGTVVFLHDRLGVLQGSGDTRHLGRPLWDLVDKTFQDGIRELFSSEPRAQQRGLVQAAFTDAGGKTRNVEVSVLPLREAGAVHGYAGSMMDVTARVAAQQRLREQLGFMELLTESSPLPNCVTDATQRYVLVNRAWENFTGRSRDQILGTPVRDVLGPEEAEWDLARDKNVRHWGQAIRSETQLRRADGLLRDVIIDKLPIPGDDETSPRIMSVISDVTEFRDAERAIREARDAAEASSRVKSEFIANISHELRTPLQSIIGFSELGLRRAADASRLMEMLKEIHSSGYRMLALVNDLLDVSRLEGTAGSMVMARTEVGSLVADVVRELEPLASGRALRLQWDPTDRGLHAEVDALRIRQVFRNVLANAIKFAPEGSVVEVEGALEPEGGTHWRVSDRGPGVPAHEIETIFEAFVQSSATKDGAGGTGLGLAICRRILEVHGGRIYAENRVGGGAVFHILLPAPTPEGAALPDATMLVTTLTPQDTPLT